MVGLDAAGKTTILYKLKLGEGEKTGKFYPPTQDPCRNLAANLSMRQLCYCFLHTFFLSCV